MRSGLDDSMRGALQEMRTILHEKENATDFRMAAYFVASEKIAATYDLKGY